MKRLICSSQTENFQRKRDFLKGSPNFPNGNVRSICSLLLFPDPFSLHLYLWKCLWNKHIPGDSIALRSASLLRIISCVISARCCHPGGFPLRLSSSFLLNEYGDLSFFPEYFCPSFHCLYIERVIKNFHVRKITYF